MDRMFEEAFLANAQVGFFTGIQDQADICDFFLLELFCKELVWVAGIQAPIYPAERIAGLVETHSPEIRACASFAGRDRAGRVEGAVRTEGQAAEVIELRFYRNLSLSWKPVRPPYQAKWITYPGVD